MEASGDDDDIVPIMSVDELTPGKARSIKVKGKNIAIFNVAGKFFAINNICPHKGGPLGKGRLKGHVVNCPWHDLQFDVRSGFGTDGGGQCVASYDVHVKDEQVYVNTKCRGM
ncbi:MAG: Rieske 2Fe-2S domain-containing protein [Nitrospirae bacterium]|nr:Rieske 2Fe-2S domain-containing protein [Nitrospirota bacterium]